MPSRLMPSTTLAVSINRDPQAVYAFVADPGNLPRWASGLGTVRTAPSGEIVADTPQGLATIRFAPASPWGILDHSVRLANGELINVPMRVVANGQGSTILFTLFQRPEMSDQAFADDQRWVQRDLETLQALLDAEPAIGDRALATTESGCHKP